MKNFFGSKLNSVLLLVLIILMIITIGIMRKNKTDYLGALGIKKEVPVFEYETEPPMNINFQIADTYGYTVPIRGVWISWGGRQSACSENQFGKFIYGESTLTCLRGLRLELGSQLPYTITQQDKNSFGDFVNDNK
ncbi:MAG: hypothetical protein WC662_01210 [Candidatus Paceibacterota bacterium]|jgi:hypothetical protein